MRPQVFLSHSGADGAATSHFGVKLEEAFGRRIKVFCTSRPGDRIEPGDPRGLDDAQLRQYLLDNLVSSQLHLVLATANSMLRGNNWVSYELQLASELKAAPILVIIGNTLPVVRKDDPRTEWLEPLTPREVRDRIRGITPSSTPTLWLDDEGRRSVVKHIAEVFGLPPVDATMVNECTALWR